MPRITKNKIIFDGEDWLSDVENLLNSEFQRGQKGIVANSFDPIRTYGYAQPGFLPVDAVNIAAVTGQLKVGIKSSLSTGYAGGFDGKLYELTNIVSIPCTVTNAGSFPYTIAGANPSVSDLKRYYIGTAPPTPFLFYSYGTTNFWDVGTYDFAGTFADTFMSTTPANPLANPDRADGYAYPHPMIVGDNNVLYIGDRNFVHAYNGSIGANGTFYSRVLDLPVGYIITAIVNYQFYLVIFAYRANATGDLLSESKAFFWDTFSSSYLYAKDLNLINVTEAINYRDTLVCFGNANLDGMYSISGEVKIFDGSNFVTLKKGVFAPIHGGADVVGDNFFWLGSGKVTFYGGLGEKKNFHEIYTDFNGTSGMLKFFSQNYNPAISLGGGAGQKLEVLGRNYNTTAFVRTRTVEPEFPEYLQGKLKSITVVYQKPVSGGRELKLEYFADTNSTTLFSGKTTVDDLIERYEYNSDGSPINSVSFNQIRLALTWGAGAGNTIAPAVSRVEMEYEPISIKNT